MKQEATSMKQLQKSLEQENKQQQENYQNLLKQYDVLEAKVRASINE